MSAPITGLYAALCALVLLGLAVRVSWVRRRAEIFLGDGGDPALQRAVRAHANAAENMPLALLLLLTVELAGTAGWLLHGAGIALVAGRILHGWGLNRSAGASFGRVAGMALTWGTMGVLAGIALTAAAGLPLT
ncbi:MAPEG family protein [Thiohalorhabdus sp.]|uniref:MAPEG family protein n=1 Tax=Thiohalorhabdus sp. TaxID=3094134 RepID=UPI002FC2AEA8